MNEGHNSGIAHDQLRAIISRLENLNESKAAVSADIKEVMSEARGNGYDTATIRKVIRWRSVERAKREADEAMFALYSDAVGDGEL